MLKELRELVGFVLNFLSDIFELVRTSQLSASPIHTLGRDRAIALQLSGVVGIVLIGVFIHAFQAVTASVDILAFGTITIAYFTVAAFLISLLLRYLGPNPDHTLTASENNQKATEVQVDSTSYVICFNLVALIVFAIARDFLYFFISVKSIIPPTIVAALLAGVVMLVFGRKGPSPLTLAQKALVVLILIGSFLAYATVVTSGGSLS